MTGLHLAHLFVLGLWGGLVLAELVLELGARAPEELRAAARLHHRLDLMFELPLLLAVLATGVALSLRVPLTGLHGMKIGAALLAIAANLVCVVLVVQRRRALDDAARVERLSRWIRLTGIGAPAGLVALVLGFHLVA